MIDIGWLIYFLGMLASFKRNKDMHLLNHRSNYIKHWRNKILGKEQEV